MVKSNTVVHRSRGWWVGAVVCLMVVALPEPAALAKSAKTAPVVATDPALQEGDKAAASSREFNSFSQSLKQLGAGSSAKTRGSDGLAASNLQESEIGTVNGRQVRRVTLSLKQLGAWSSIKLRGVDGNQTLAFPVRADEVVIGATLRIGYDYSPSL